MRYTRTAGDPISTIKQCCHLLLEADVIDNTFAVMNAHSW